MEDDTILLVGGLALGGYALYKVLNDSGITSTTSAIGNVAQNGASLVNAGTQDLLTANKAVQNAINGLGNGSDAQTLGNAIGSIPQSIISNDVKFASGIGQAITNTSAYLFGTPTTDQNIITYKAATAQPITTHNAITTSGAMFSSVAPLTANVSTKYGAAAQTNVVSIPSSLLKTTGSQSFGTTGIKSTGASGKYKTTI